MLELLNKYKKQIAYVIIGLFLLYGIIWIATRKPQMSADIKATIDSLTNVNKQLIEHQKQIDSIIHVYEAEVKQVDNQIDNIKEKTTIIKEYYHEVSQQVEHYTPPQIDSFFHQRYNY
jgi:peptidoglycan hydrolase CwlO-like protein